jgi:HK97 family phage major capsid protein
MTRREALAKATITTSDAASGLLDPVQGNAFIRKLKESTSLANAIRQETRTATAGEINKIATGARIIRAATENADDGYRAGATFATVPFSTRKLRLPWEVTEDVFHENIEGSGLEGTLVDEMTTQFALDLEDLEINGDTAAGAGADQAFLQINDGILKMITAAAVAGRRINGATIDTGVWGKNHMFEMLYAMPNVYRRSGNLRWIMSPARAIQWWESITNRATASGDSALLGAGGAIDRPLGIPVLEVPALPDSTVLLADPRNFVRVISWQIRRRKVTGDTDAELAAKDKRFYIYFLKHDVVIEETDAVVQTYGLVAV